MSALRWGLAAFALAFGVSACTSFTDVTQKRPYSCTWRDAGVDECPEGWRCGYDNRCFDPKTPVGLKTCKFHADCFDGYRCDTNNQCFNPAIEEARACGETADCAPGWRCGITNVCQNTNDGGAYPCRADTDCEQGWRCDVLAHVCADVDDTLFGSPQTVTVNHVHPSAERPVPMQVAVGHFVDNVQNGPKLFASLYDGGVVELFARVRDGDELPVVQTVTLPVPSSQVADLVAVNDHAFARTTSGQVYVLSLDAGVMLIGNNVRRLRQVDPAPTSLKMLTTSPAILALNEDSTYMRLSVDLNDVRFDGGPYDAGPTATPPVLLDVAGVDNEVYALRDWGVFHDPSAEPLGCGVELFPAEARVINSDGGVRQCQDQEPWGPVVRLDAGVRYQLLVTRAGSLYGLGVVSTFDDGHVVGSLAITTGTAYSNQNRTSRPSILCPDSSAPLQLSLAMSATAGNDPLSFLSRCRAVTFDGGYVPAANWVVTINGDRVKFNQLNGDDPAPWRQGIRAQTTSSNQRAHAGRNGLIWYADATSAGAPLLAPLKLDRQPGGILRIVQGSKRATVALTDQYMYSVTPNDGFVVQGDTVVGSETADFVPAGTVEGKPNWQVTRRGIIDLAHFPLGSDAPRFVARIAADDTVLSAPASGQVQTLPDGTRLLVVVSGDRLLTADVTATEPNPYFPASPLQVRLIPSPGVRLRGLSIDPTPRQTSDAGTSIIASGFLLTDSALFAFSASSPTRWSLLPVPLPEQFGVPLQLWSENGRARLAFDRGTVMTLPERVPISPDLPPSADAGPVADFARLCGTTFALRADGLYRALPTDGGIAWSTIALPTVPAEELPQARFYETEGSVFVATTTGRVVELSVARDDGGSPYCP